MKLATVLALSASLWFGRAAAAQDGRVDEQLQRSLATYRTADDWAARRAELREQFLRATKLWPLPGKPPLRVIRHSRREHDGYAVENVALETLPGFYCTGNLYSPLKTPPIAGGQRPPGAGATKFPAILSPHGHFQPLGRYREEQQIRCAHLARMGAVVFSYSMVGWQDSQQTTHSDPLVLALQTWNSIRAVDFLTGLDEVDSERIGVTGASGGGTQTLFVTLVDERVKASAPAVIVYPWSWFSPACNCEGGMPVMKAADTNAVEFAAATAPRPQLIISCGMLSPGRSQPDPTHNFPAVGFPFIQEVYRRTGHADRVRNLHLPDDAHDFGPSKRKAVYAFFAEHLGLKLLNEDAGTISIEPPEKLTAFNDAHPLPANSVHGTAEVAEAFANLPRPAP
jgi:hypothetical protein